MKTTLLSTLLVASLSLFSQEPPKFLDGFNYKTEKAVSDDGEAFDCYVVSAKNNEEFKSLKKLFRSMKYESTWVSGGIVYRARSNGKYTMILGRAPGFQAFSVYEN